MDCWRAPWTCRVVPFFLLFAHLQRQTQFNPVGASPKTEWGILKMPTAKLPFLMILRPARQNTALHKLGDRCPSHLNLQASDVGDSHAEHTTHYHHEPEKAGVDGRVVVDDRDLAKDQHQWEEQEASIKIVVHLQTPQVGLDDRQVLLGEDGVKRHTGTG